MPCPRELLPLPKRPPIRDPWLPVAPPWAYSSAPLLVEKLSPCWRAPQSNPASPSDSFFPDRDRRRIGLQKAASCRPKMWGQPGNRRRILLQPLPPALGAWMARYIPPATPPITTASFVTPRAQHGPISYATDMPTLNLLKSLGVTRGPAHTFLCQKATDGKIQHTPATLFS